MEYFLESDFELLEKHGGSSLNVDDEEYKELEYLYNKLKHLIDHLPSDEYKYNIRRAPLNQGQQVAHYHWSQVCPKDLYETCKNKISFVIGANSNGIYTHIDGSNRAGNAYMDLPEAQAVSSKTFKYYSIEEFNSYQALADELTKCMIKLKPQLIELGASVGIAECIKQSDEMKINSKIDILKANYNMILTGAPGTGKTYFAKKMAMRMIFGEDKNENQLTSQEQSLFNRHCAFVQFHPSFDYTDFVEGLRAEEVDGQVTFRLHNGIFKEFCKRAIENITHSIESNFEEMYKKLTNDISEEPLSLKTPHRKKPFTVEVSSTGSCIAIPDTIRGTRLSITKEYLKRYLYHGEIIDWSSYLIPLADYFKANYDLKIKKERQTGQEQNLPYIFIIDEINRGEISKIFGELFFSIDPGYRGIEGKVITQFSNIQEGETIFDHSAEVGEGYFYVPENVYIIGTMNDIDRSVESMDFAMRRRFAWQEIKANENLDMLEMLSEVDENLPREARKKVLALNRAIWDEEQNRGVEGLSASFHIGGAYFLKLLEYEGDFVKLWELHISSLLREYLRGMPNAEGKLAELKVAYDITGEEQ